MSPSPAPPAAILGRCTFAWNVPRPTAARSPPPSSSSSSQPGELRTPLTAEPRRLARCRRRRYSERVVMLWGGGRGPHGGTEGGPLVQAYILLTCMAYARVSCVWGGGQSVCSLSISSHSFSPCEGHAVDDVAGGEGVEVKVDREPGGEDERRAQAEESTAG